MAERVGFQAQLAELAREVLAMPREELDKIVIAWQARVIVQTPKNVRAIKSLPLADIQLMAIFIVAQERHTLGPLDAQGRLMVNDALERGAGAVLRVAKTSKAGIRTWVPAV